jgi:mRNA interferase YafQ
VRVAVRSGQFRRDVKQGQRRGKDMGKVRELILLLLAEAPLPARYRDHPCGQLERLSRRPIEPNWLLIYRIVGDELHLVRTGSHPDLLDEWAAIALPCGKPPRRADGLCVSR